MESHNNGHRDAFRRLSAVSRNLQPEADGPALRAYLSARMAASEHWLRDLSDEEKVVHIQACRTAGFFEPPVAFYMVAAFIMRAAERHEDALFARDFADKLDAIERREGLNVEEGEYWPIGEGPDDYRALLAEYDAVRARAVADVFRACHEPDMADLYLNDRATFDARFEAGRVIVHGPLPDWITKGTPA